MKTIVKILKFVILAAFATGVSAFLIDFHRWKKEHADELYSEYDIK